MKSIKNLSAAITGLIIILIGSMIPSSIFVPGKYLAFEVLDLPSSWQVPALLLTGLVCGPSQGTIATVAYLTLGLFYLPVFHGGGSIGYLATPEFGYLAGFIPAVWVTGRMALAKKKNMLNQLFKACLCGLTIIHSIGIINLLIGTLFSRWSDSLLELFLIHSVAIFPIQIILCTGVVILAKYIRKLLLIE